MYERSPDPRLLLSDTLKVNIPYIKRFNKKKTTISNTLIIIFILLCFTTVHLFFLT